MLHILSRIMGPLSYNVSKLARRPNLGPKTFIYSARMHLRGVDTTEVHAQALHLLAWHAAQDLLTDNTYELHMGQSLIPTVLIQMGSDL